MIIEAAVLPGRGQPLRIDQVTLSEPRPDEVLVAIEGCGVCHADALAQHGDLPFPAPGVLGHEGTGRIVQLGSAVESLEVGDRVVLGMPFCGRCEACCAGQPRYCAGIPELLVSGSRSDGSTSLRWGQGRLHSHFFGQSAFATHAVVRANQSLKINGDAQLAQLAPLGCAVSTGAGAIFNVLRPGPGASLAVFGVGSVGLSAIMAARSTATTTIVAIDRHRARLELAREFGATATVDAAEDDAGSAVREVCGGFADFSLDCTGNLRVIRTAVDVVGKLGVCGLVGGALAGAEMTLDHFTTLIGKRIVGIHGGDGTSGTLIPALLELNRQGRLPYHRLVTEFDFQQVNEAMEAAHSGDVVKPVLRMS